jgi:hypothetical protein
MIDTKLLYSDDEKESKAIENKSIGVSLPL